MYKINDVVCLVGSTKDNKGKVYDFKLGRVIEIALFDLIVEPIDSFWKSHIRVSKESCQYIDVSNIKNDLRFELAEIGDLVMHYSHGYQQAPKKVIGILVSIQSIPGNPPRGKVMTNGEGKDFNLEDLIIIEKYSKSVYIDNM
tara:strand:+ start:564 stop:992 length:429 start_codon:yes stop_codon:yes gene_type:complete